jgi:hypothetical protein
MALQGINDAKHWRDRATEIRVLSDEIKDPQAQRIMLKLANDYDKLANRAEGRAARDSVGPSPIPKTGWQHIATAPFDCDLEVAVINHDGAHALAFPCRRILGGWADAITKKLVAVNPTHWREWQRLKRT